MPIFNKFTYCNMAKGGHKQKEVFTKYIYTKAIARKNTLRQDNFRNVLGVTISVKYFNAS